MIINVVCLSIRRILQPFPSESSSPIECCLKRILEGKCHFPEETQSHSPDSHVYQTYLRIRIDTFLSWYLGIRGTHPETNTDSVLLTGEPNSVPPRTNLVDPQMEKDSSLTEVQLLAPGSADGISQLSELSATLQFSQFGRLPGLRDRRLSAEADLKPIKTSPRPRTARMEFLCKDLWPSLSPMSGIVGVRCMGNIIRDIWSPLERPPILEQVRPYLPACLPGWTPREILSNFRLLPLKRSFWQEC